ncbi:vigilin [Scheffersomyces xylosifermentans]|uniref:vigilin n=1 Tax=Scheffersomyces xylosifermentans TaxID=1304137 RepID=UPI00315C9226
MPTPAEIIAARVNNSLDEAANSATSDVTTESADDYSYSSNSAAQDDQESVATSASARSISDESAFPALGGGKKSPSVSGTSTPSWGPSMKTPISGSPSPALRAKSPATPAPKATNGNRFKVSTIQEAFSLDVEDQLNVARPEFIKILTTVKADTNTNIECTTSQHTKKRTFLITGKPEDVKTAKRIVIKKLTKPVTSVFTVPAKIRSRIIGPQGKTLKPIIQENDVKIDIGNVEETPEVSDENEDEDDIFAQTIKITIDGDVEGCKRAKSLILAIVKEETKNLTAKIKVDDLVKPFAGSALKSIIAKYSDLDISIPDYKTSSNTILISGNRELALQAKSEINEALSALSGKIVVEEVPIPKVKHQFLPISSILEEENVLIKLPAEGESNVKFIGEKKKLAAAKEKARQTTSAYKVEVLDMSKAHKGNLKHVKAVAALLNKNGVFKEIASSHDVSINVPSIKTLSDESIASIPIEIVSKNDDAEQIKNVRKAIVQVVNKITPDQTKVVEDIDPFFLAKVPETIKDAAKQNKVSYVILGKQITLFSDEQEQESEDFDFVESADSTSAFAKVDESLNSLRELASNLEAVVLSVPAKDQAVISGPRGTTLKSILNDVEANSVTVKFHSNGEKNSDDEIYIHGVKSEVAKVKKDIAAVLADAQEYKEGYSATVSVPSGTLSRLIGKSGAHLNAIRDQFGVKIDVSDEGKDDDKKDASSKTDIVISGIKRNVEQAKADIHNQAKKLADETLTRIKIESQYHRRMIGQNGIYINRLQDKYNVKIRFPSVDGANGSAFADAPKTKDEVTIKGPSKGVAKAEEELKELYQFEKENGFKETIKIPTKAIARVIGKSGETINDIADGSGIEYKFKRDTESEESLGYAEVELTGSKSALKEATKKIQEIIEEIENFASVTIKVDPKYHRDLIGQGGSVMKEIISKAGGDDLPRSKYFRLLSIPNEGSGSDEVTSQGDKSIVDKVIEQVNKIVANKVASISEDFELAKEKHRLIVGPSGSIRHSLQEEFGASIDIPRPSDASTTIKLSGLPENVEALKAKIIELTKDDWNLSIDIPEAYHALVSEKGAIFKKLKSDFNVEVQHGNLTRQAAKLSSSSIPTPPEEAFAVDDAATKFTIVDNTVVDESDGVVIPWRLKGSAESTAKAAKLIEERLANAKAAKSVGWFYSKNPSVFSKIVGPQGSKINQIRKKTNTFITVPRANDKNPNFVYLIGSEENLEKAKSEIEHALKN